MRRLAALALLLSLASDAGPRAMRFLAPGGAGRPKAAASSSAPGCSQSIDCAIQAGDKVGNWWALKADGTMLSGSSLTESAHGSPTVSPITLNGTTQYYDSAAVAFPATSQSFSIMFVAKFNDVTAAYVAAKWPVANQTFICGVAVSNPIFYAFSSTPTFVPNTSAGVVSTGTWVGICCSFNSSTQDGNVRYSGVNSLVSIGPSTQNTTSAQTVGSTAATPTFNGQLRGVFYTETDACGAASDRVIAGAM